MRTAVVTAFAKNPIGQLLEDLILQGGVDTSLIRWVPYDGIGRTVRNGLNFTERGFGVRAAVGCSDRGHTAIANSQPSDFDWQNIFVARVLAGCIPAEFLLRSLVRRRWWRKPPLQSAKNSGTVVSYDLNYRESLWKGIGGKAKAQDVNRELVSQVDVLFGNEEDFSAALGIAIEGVSPDFSDLQIASYESMLHRVADLYPNLKLIATTLRTAHTATKNDWGAIALCGGEIIHVPQRR